MGSLNIEEMSREDLIEYIKMLDADLDKEKALRSKEAEDYKALEEEYEKEIAELHRSLTQANGKIISQNITLESYKSKMGIPLIIEGSEKDLYTDEQKEFLISLVANAMNSYEKFTRPYKICESILNANHSSKRKDELKEALTTIFSSYVRIDSKVHQAVHTLGMKLTDCGNGHYKLSFINDDRWNISISATPSDFRAGQNVVSDINKMFF